MVEKYFGGELKLSREAAPEDAELLAKAANTIRVYRESFAALDFSTAIQAVNDLVSATNKYVDVTAPWALAKAGRTERLSTVLYNILDVIRVATIALAPVLPESCNKVWTQLGLSGSPAEPNPLTLSPGQLPHTLTTKKADPVFPRWER